MNHSRDDLCLATESYVGKRDFPVDLNAVILLVALNFLCALFLDMLVVHLHFIMNTWTASSSQTPKQRLKQRLGIVLCSSESSFTKALRPVASHFGLFLTLDELIGLSFVSKGVHIIFGFSSDEVWSKHDQEINERLCYTTGFFSRFVLLYVQRTPTDRPHVALRSQVDIQCTLHRTFRAKVTTTLHGQFSELAISLPVQDTSATTGDMLSFAGLGAGFESPTKNRAELNAAGLWPLLLPESATQFTFRTNMQNLRNAEQHASSWMSEDPRFFSLVSNEEAGLIGILQRTFLIMFFVFGLGAWPLLFQKAGAHAIRSEELVRYGVSGAMFGLVLDRRVHISYLVWSGLTLVALFSIFLEKDVNVYWRNWLPVTSCFVMEICAWLDLLALNELSWLTLLEMFRSKVIVWYISFIDRDIWHLADPNCFVARMRLARTLLLAALCWVVMRRIVRSLILREDLPFEQFVCIVFFASQICLESEWYLVVTAGTVLNETIWFAAKLCTWKQKRKAQLSMVLCLLLNVLSVFALCCKFPTLWFFVEGLFVRCEVWWLSAFQLLVEHERRQTKVAAGPTASALILLVASMIQDPCMEPVRVCTTVIWLAFYAATSH